MARWQMPKYKIMRRTKYWFVILILISLDILGCGSRQGELNGEIFIVTKGRENIRMGLVTVQVISEEKMKEFIAKKNSESKIEMGKMQPDIDKAKIEVEKAHVELEKANKEYDSAYKNRRKHKAYMKWLDLVEIRQKKSRFWFKKVDEAAILTVKQNYYKSGKFYFNGLPDAIVTNKTDADGKFKLNIQRNKRVALAAYATRRTPNGEEEYYWLLWISLDGKPEKKILLSNDNLTDSGSKDSVIATVKWRPRKGPLFNPF